MSLSNEMSFNYITYYSSEYNATKTCSFVIEYIESMYSI